MSKSEAMKPNQPTEYLPQQVGEVGEAKTLLEWVAPARPFRKKNRSYYTTIAILVVLLVLIAILAREFLLIGVLLSLAFVVYVLAFVPPHDVTYRISTQGITVDNNFYFWHLLDSFWFNDKEGHLVLFVQTKMKMPKQLMLVLGKHNEEAIKKNVVRFIPFHEIPKTTLMERWADKLQNTFPLETPHK